MPLDWERKLPSKGYLSWKTKEETLSANILFWRVAVIQLDDYQEASTYHAEMSKASFSTGLRIVGAETSVNAKKKKKKKKKMQKGEKLRNVVYKIGIIKFSLNEKMIYLYQVFFLVVIIKFIVKMFNRWLRFNSNNQGI
jgi:hypothetical protein